MSRTAAATKDLSPRKRQLLELMLAERREERKKQTLAGLEELPRADRTGRLPLSFVQQRLWFLSQLDPASPAYNIPAAVYLVGPLDAGLLARSYDSVVVRHEDLRTNFLKDGGGEPYAVIVPERQLAMPVVDLSRLTPSTAEEEAQDLVPVVAMVPYDLTRDPLIRLRLIRLAPEAHLLLLVVHHIIVDVWSIGVFFREIGAFYDGLVAGRAPDLPPLELQYADYVEWQRRTLEESGELARQLEYWTKQLADARPVIELPADFPRPALQTFRGKRHSMRLGGNIHERLREIARPEEASLYMAALTVFYALLYRYTGQHDILVGTPMANRNRVEFEPLIGFFVNTVVLRAEVEGGVAFRQLLRQVRSTALEAFAHHDLPFERVVNDLKVARDLSRNPLYQVDFAFQNLPEVKLSTPGLELRPFVLRETTSRFDLELDLKEAPDGFDGFIRFNTALFEPVTIERMGRYFGNLLRAVVADPDRPVAALEMLDAAEIEQLVHGWNDTATGLPEGSLAPRRIAAWAAHTPTATAVVGAGGEELGFGDLDRRSNRLARHLVASGAGAEPIVALALPRSLELVVGLLAVWKAGGAYLPLDAEHPPERLRFLLADAAVRRVLTITSMHEALPVLAEDGREVLCLDALPPEVGEAADTPLEIEVEPEGAAYVIYTSGSTGRPKGVVVQHLALANYLNWCERAYGAGEGEGSLVHSSLGFDLTVTSVLAPLAAGRPVRMVAEGEGIEPLADAVLAGTDLGLLKLTPAHLEALSELLTEVGAAGRARTLVIGGEALHRGTLDFWRRNAPDSRLVNEYGPTETVVGCSTYVVSADLDGRGAVAETVPIGEPIQNARLHLVDADFNLVPPGARGELTVGGIGVARGYLGRPVQTAERFVPDPFDAAPGARLYRTGDRARRLGDGSLVFLGRVDHQVKVRGFRIEPEEIESVLNAHPDVQSAVVTARDDLPGGATGLVAYVAAPKARNLRDEDLRAQVAAHLPDYMVPAFFVFLPALPLTVNGKVDRRALPSPGAVVSRDSDYVAPRTPTEVQVARIWAEVLRVDRVSVTDRFFELGGQSMLAVQVVSRVRDALQVELPVQSLFNDTTIASLSAEVDAAAARGATADAPPIEPVSRDQDLPLSFAQERLWFIDQLMPGLTAYHIPGAVRMRGELQRPALERALGEIIRRHEVLRTTFDHRHGRPIQVVHAEMPLRLVRVDLRGLAPAEREARGMELARQAVRLPFDLSRGPLMRALLVELAADDVLFVLAIHHIVYDMWSRDVFLGELVTLYEAFSDGRPSNLPPLAVQYADFAAWQRRWLSGEVLDAQIEFWRRRLDGVESLELPADRPRPAVQTLRGARVSRVLTPELTTALKRGARRQKVTLFVALLSGFYAFLHRYTGLDDLAVGSPIANRNRVEIEPLMGFFANTLVLRTRLEPRITGGELLARVRDLTLESYAHQDLAFEKLVEVLQPERDLARQPLFQVMFNYLVNYKPPTLKLPRLTLETETVHTGGVPFDFTLSMFEADGRLHVMVDYGKDLFDGTTVDRMLRHFASLLEGLAARPGDPLARLPMLSRAERHQLLGEWNATAPAADVRPVPGRIAEVAARRPDAIAVAAGGVALSYGELAARAGRLAARLRRLGVGPEVKVGVCMERRPALLVAQYAVWQAGGAYLPLDPGDPPSRLAFLLADSGAQLWIADRHAPEASGSDVPRLDPDGIGEAGEPEESVPAALAQAHHLAYVIYTSGSTGVPKGVEICHGALAGLVAWHQRAFAVTAEDRATHLAGLGFDASVWEVWPHLAAGARLELPEEAVRVSPERLRDWLLERRASLSFLPTPLAEAVVALDWPDAVPLRRLLTGGDRLRRPPRAGLPFVLVNNYGPTESTVVATSAPVPAAAGAGAPSIGWPIDGVTAQVVDPGLQPLPITVAGELVLGGDHLARGYLGRPGLTAGRFVPDPWVGRPGARLYRTGDLVRRSGDGSLDFTGRIDQQVKVRGYRIEPGEIEAVLADVPQVEACAVVAPEVADGSRQLVAWVVPAGGAPLDPAALLRALSARLPDHLVPRTILPVAELPVTDHGKIDRAALLARTPHGDEAGGVEAEAPRNPIEEALAATWADLLGRPRVGIHDDFFALGGHSLLASQLVSRLRETLEVDLPLRIVFERPTVAGQAEAIESLRWLAGEPAAAAEGEEEGEL